MLLTGYHGSLYVIRVLVVTLMCVIYVDNVFVSDQVIFNHEQSGIAAPKVQQSWDGCTLRFSLYHNYDTDVFITLYFKYSAVQRVPQHL